MEALPSPLQKFIMRKCIQGLNTFSNDELLHTAVYYYYLVFLKNTLPNSKVHGAAVYSLDRKHNTNSNAVEMAILEHVSKSFVPQTNALYKTFQCSVPVFTLVGYASKEATNEVGFVREVRPAELKKFAEENMKDLRER
ncbi:hypothetical protein DdX_21090 [Ditylenchus destructor]|uniref:Uncharacterized protein n=1 Tax=Ditylenchus destructor TaxID=166010 RepID=A0AAD4MGA4_9BILA|nr:hypothetical protein DdX_21090 [Ditylenchus destructor]